MAYAEKEVVKAKKLTDYPNKPFEGYYLGTDTVNTKIGESLVHRFQKADKTKVSFWGFTQLNFKIDGLREGVMCRLTYLGAENMETKFGLRDVHQVKVEYDTEKILDGFKEKEPEDDKDLPF